MSYLDRLFGFAVTTDPEDGSRKKIVPIEEAHLRNATGNRFSTGVGSLCYQPGIEEGEEASEGQREHRDPGSKHLSVIELSDSSSEDRIQAGCKKRPTFSAHGRGEYAVVTAQKEPLSEGQQHLGQNEVPGSLQRGGRTRDGQKSRSSDGDVRVNNQELSKMQRFLQVQQQQQVDEHRRQQARIRRESQYLTEGGPQLSWWQRRAQGLRRTAKTLIPWRDREPDLMKVDAWGGGYGKSDALFYGSRLERNRPYMEDSDADGPFGRDKGWLHRFAFSRELEMFVVFIVILDCVMVGVETECRYGRHRNGAPLGQWSIKWLILELINLTFTLVYTTEVILKVLAVGLPAYLRDPANQFDSFFTLLSIGADVASWTCVYITHDPLPADLFQVLGVLRMLRTVRLLRRFLSVNILIRGLFYSISSLLWVSVFAFMLIYVYANLTTRFFVGIDAPSQDPQMHFRFGGLGSSMFTLFLMLTFDGWSDVGFLTIQEVPWSWLAFTVYSALGGLIVLKIVTSVCVENYVDASRAIQLEAQYRVVLEEEGKNQEVLQRAMLDALIEEDGKQANGGGGGENNGGEGGGEAKGAADHNTLSTESAERRASDAIPNQKSASLLVPSRTLAQANYGDSASAAAAEATPSTIDLCRSTDWDRAPSGSKTPATLRSSKGGTYRADPFERELRPRKSDKEQTFTSIVGTLDSKKRVPAEAPSAPSLDCEALPVRTRRTSSFESRKRSDAKSKGTSPMSRILNSPMSPGVYGGGVTTTMLELPRLLHQPEGTHHHHHHHQQTALRLGSPALTGRLLDVPMEPSLLTPGSAVIRSPVLQPLLRVPSESNHQGRKASSLSSLDRKRLSQSGVSPGGSGAADSSPRLRGCDVAGHAGEVQEGLKGAAEGYIYVAAVPNLTRHAAPQNEAVAREGREGRINLLNTTPEAVYAKCAGAFAASNINKAQVVDAIELMQSYGLKSCTVAELVEALGWITSQSTGRQLLIAQVENRSYYALMQQQINAMKAAVEETEDLVQSLCHQLVPPPSSGFGIGTSRIGNIGASLQSLPGTVARGSRLLRRDTTTTLTKLTTDQRRRETIARDDRAASRRAAPPWRNSVCV